MKSSVKTEDKAFILLEKKTVLLTIFVIYLCLLCVAILKCIKSSRATWVRGFVAFELI